MKKFTILAYLLLSITLNAFAQPPRIPYPIIFVHGWNGDDSAWDNIRSYLGGGDRTFHVCLNHDYNIYEANLMENIPGGDIHHVGWSGSTNVGIYAINFDSKKFINTNGTPNKDHETHLLSNEAAIFKQGKALRKVIEDVLKEESDHDRETDKVILVGHSMGGLAIREYLQRGNGINWVDQNTNDGHKVAKVVTIGTPHLGSNFDIDFEIKNLEIGPNLRVLGIPITEVETIGEFYFELDTKSEAVRDLRYNYNTEGALFLKGLYLFGGSEADLPHQTYHNTNVNCDPNEDNVIGINSGSIRTIDNPDMPLPKNIKYTWVRSNVINSNTLEMLNGDVIVDIDRQWLYNDNNQPYPVDISDTLLMNKFHFTIPNVIDGETRDVYNIIRSLDEPELKNLAYKIPLGNSIRGRITYRSNNNGNTLDVDVYKITTPAYGRLKISLNPNSSPTAGLALSDDNGNIASKPGDGPQNIIINNTTPNKSYYVWVNGNANSNSYNNEYILSTSTKYLSSPLISPTIASSTDPITFTIKYTSDPSEAPDYVRIIIDGIPYNMSTLYSNWSAPGAIYSYVSGALSPGEHTYYYEASANGSTAGLRYPQSGSLSFTIGQSVAGWELSATTLNSSPTYMLTGQAVTVSATVYNGSDTNDKIYNNVLYSFQLFGPTGALVSEAQGTISTLSRLATTTVSKTVYTQNTIGNYTCIFKISPDKDNNTANNTLSNQLIVGQNGPSRQYYFTSAESFVQLNSSDPSHEFNISGNYTYTLKAIAKRNDLTYINISQNGGTSREIFLNEFREYNSNTTALIAEAADIGSLTAFVSFGYSNTNFVTFDKTNITAYPGSDVYFIAQCATCTFSSASPYIYRNQDVDNWYKSLSRFDNNKRTQFKFTIPNNTSTGVYSFWLASVFSNNDKFLRELTITVVAPPPTITTLSKTNISADDQITISGSNLGSSGTVKFGSIASSNIISWSPTSITCVVPTGIDPDPDVITVINSNGTSNGLAYTVKSVTGTPTLSKAIPDQLLWPNQTLEIGDLDDYFSDPNEGPLTYVINTNNPLISYDQSTFSTDHILRLIGGNDLTTGSQISVTAIDNTNKQVEGKFNVVLPQKPSVSTNPVTAPTETQAQGGGSVTYDGNDPVISRGVCWSSVNNPPTTEDNILFDASGGLGTFQSIITGLTPGTKYYLRAFAVNNAGPGYGPVETFTTLGSNNIIDFTPQSGSFGTTVTITGNNFNSIPENNIVRFNGTQALVLSASPSELKVTVPNGATTGPITVETNDITISSTSVFTIQSQSATLTGFSPVSGAVGAIIKITGTNFSSNSIIMFNGVIAQRISGNSTELIASVPSGASSGTITVDIDGTVLTSSSYFIVLPTPAIIGINPEAGVIGTTVIISGTNFNPTPQENIVNFNNIVATVTDGSISQLTVTVPPGATTGPVSIAANGVTISSAFNFTVLLPNVLEINSTNPQPHTLNVAANSNIELTFNNNINQLTADNGTSGNFNDDHILILGNQTGYYNGVFSGNGTSTLTFNPATDFKAGELITVIIKKEVTDVNNNALAKAETFQFSIATAIAPGNFSGGEKIITNNVYRPQEVNAADLDNDGDLDIVAAIEWGAKITWYENGKNWEEKVISTDNQEGVISVYTADIDKDGDLDVISSSNGTEPQVNWYENGNGWAKTSISTTFMRSQSGYPADLDGDGDIDILNASYTTSTLSWFENGNNWNEKIISNSVIGYSKVSAVDIDSDGDLDVICSSANENTISWYENGNNWNKTIITNNSQAAQGVISADIDKDGDPDVLSAGYDANEIAWYENGNNWTKQIITTSAQGAFGVHVGDVDGDGDIDALSASYKDSRIAWYENGNNWNEKTISNTATNTTFVTAVDMDGDKDLDVISSSHEGSKISWYENNTPQTEPGLIAYYPFNNTPNDESGNLNHGMIKNGVSPTTDRFGNSDAAYYFDGSGAYIEVPNSPSLQSPGSAITMAGWINIESYPGIRVAPLIQKAISSAYGQYGMSIHAWNGYLTANLGTGGYSKPQSFDLNTWYFIASTWDGNTVTLYLNGVAIGTGVYTEPLVADANPLVIGLDSPGQDEYLKGKIDDIRIYNRALSPVEIEALYREDQGLIAYYPFNNNTLDESGNGNDGDPKNGATPATDRFGNSNSAYQFDGIDDYIEIPNSATLQSPTNKLSIAGWLNIAGYPGLEVAPLVQKSNSAASSQYGFSPQAYEGQLVANLGGTGAAALPYILSLNTWHFVAYTWDGAIVKFHVDGVEVGSVPYSSSLVPDNQPLTIGFDSSGQPEFLQGKADDIRIYNRVLSTAEILALYGEDVEVPSIPIITSFSPHSGEVGTPVIITGNNFSITPENNTVYFGATKAVVTDATATQLTVTVPSGATYQPITITVDGLTGYSNKRFVVTFPGNRIVNSTLFANKVDYATAESESYFTAIGDFDGDGRTDLAAANYAGTTVSIFRNSSTGNLIESGSLTRIIDLASGSRPSGVTTGDLDGDSKLDLVVTNANSNSISIFRNTSMEAGTISFAAKVEFGGLATPVGAMIGDVDADGKPEIIIANNGGNTLSVFKNKSAIGSITEDSFLSKQEFITGSNPLNVNIGDLDGDGKPDLVVSNGNNTISVLRNTAFAGIIGSNTFAAKVDFNAGNGSTNRVAIGDLDGDDKPDLAVVNVHDASFSVLRNNSSEGTITSESFETKVDYPTGTRPLGISFSDLDGDGKLDIAVACENTGTVSVYKNQATVGSFNSNSFSSKVDFPKTGYSYDVTIGDLSGDGRPELIVGNGNNSVSIFKNQPPDNILISDGLVAYYPFNGSTLDASNNGNHGTNNGATPTTDRFGNEGKAMFFNGTDNYVLVPSSNSFPSTAITTAFWFNRNSINPGIGGDHYISKELSFSTYLYNDLTLASQVWKGQYGVWSSWDDGEFSLCVDDIWYFYASTFDNLTKEVKIYVNGILVNSFIETDPNAILRTSGEPLYIGRNGSSSVYFINGKLDDIRIYNRALNPSEITDLYNEGGYFPDPPSINNFSPLTGTVGTTLTINGTNFSCNTEGNIVYFGATKAVVTNATSKQLTVVVPNGATYAPVSVTTKGLSAYSTIPFTPTFTSLQSLRPEALIKTTLPSGLNPQSVVIGDIDGDGWSDIIVSNNSSQAITISRNAGNGIFEEPVYLACSGNPYYVAINDLDGDGKLDIVALEQSTQAINIFRNISTAGTLSTSSFEPRVDLPTLYSPRSVSFNDVDSDGKPDMIITYNNANAINIFKNNISQSVITSTSFATPVTINLSTNYGPENVTSADFDGDGKLDFFISYYGSGEVRIYRNAGKTGVIDDSSFISEPSLESGTFPFGGAYGDLDQDGQLDIVVTTGADGGGNNTISVFKNTSNTGAIAFMERKFNEVGSAPFNVELSDLDGDSKLDATSVNYYSGTLSVLKNISTSGEITLDTRIDLPTGSLPWDQAIGDLDGNGTPEIVVVNTADNNLTLFTNTLDKPIPAPTLLSFEPEMGVVGKEVIITGTNFSTNAQNNSVKFNDVPAIVSAATATQLTVNVPAGASTGNISVTVNNLTATSSTEFIVCETPVEPVFDAGAEAVCKGQANVIYSVIKVPGFTYEWNYDGPGVMLTPSENVITLDFSNEALSGTLSVIARNLCGTGLTSVKSITVNAIPEQPSIITGDEEVCTNSNSVIYAITNTEGYEYVWGYTGSGVTFTPNGNTVDVNFTPSAESGELSVIAKNLCGVSTASVKSIIVISPPAQPVSIIGDEAVCQGENDLIYTTTSIPDVEYEWSYSGTGVLLTPSGNSVSVNFSNTAESGILSVIAKNSCFASDATVISISVNSVPAQPSLIAGSEMVCLGDSNVIYAITNVEGLEYEWNYSEAGVTLTSTGNSVTVDFSSSALSGTLSVIATNYCGSSSSSKSIVVNKIPEQPSIIKGNEVVCQAQGNVTYSVSSIAGLTYNWSYSGSGVTLNQSENSVMLTFTNTATSGILSVTANNLCGESVASSLSILVNPQPAKPIIKSDFTNASKPILKSSSTTGNQWYLNYNAIPSATNKDYNVNQEGIYSLTVTQLGCMSEFSDPVAIIVTGDIESTKQDISIHPNPATNTIVINGITESLEFIQCADFTGRLIKLLVKRFGDSYQADVSDLPPGPYLLLIEQANATSRIRFIKN